MSDQSVFGLSTARNQGHQEIPDNREAEVLRGLAGQVAELAARPIESEKRALWYAHNALHTTRPVIFCDPENGWNEIIPEDQLKCAHELSRTWEMALRKEIYWGSSEVRRMGRRGPPADHDEGKALDRGHHEG